MWQQPVRLQSRLGTGAAARSFRLACQGEREAGRSSASAGPFEMHTPRFGVFRQPFR
jgi:hypothetical protein